MTAWYKPMNLALAMLAGVLALMWVESRWLVVGLWIFVALTLTLGFAHGALDVWLMVDAKRGLRWFPMMAYALSTVAIAVLLLPYAGAALMILIVLSLWHFGEETASQTLPTNQRLLMRYVQGGASVMLPILLSPEALKPWIAGMTGAEFFWVWSAWLAMAWTWVFTLLIAIALRQPWKNQPIHAMWWEIAALLVLNILLSPLLAFALFFGLYHALWHIGRVQRMYVRAQKSLPWGWLLLVLVLTWAALAILWWQMPQAASVAYWDASVLNWLVVALVAVTVPHLILVYRSRQALFGSA